MLRGRRLQVATAALLLLLMLGLLSVYQSQPQLYIYNPLSLWDGVPELPAPALACPPPAPQALRLRQSVADGLQRVYVITPTYPRAVQVPEMTRLAQTLMLASNVFWLVTEDAKRRTPAVTDILESSGVPHVHILGLMPEKYRKGFKGPVPRGVSNRMAALAWLRENAEDGVFYFADDDNTYDYRLFAELARTRRASAFPVGLVTHTGISTPVVRNGVVTGFYDGWIGGRTFPMDMAGFAVSVQLLLEHPEAKMPFTAGYEEDGFLKSLKLTKEDLEPLADNCTKILVWHTQTKQPKVPFSEIEVDKYRGTNLEALHPVVNPRPAAVSPGPVTYPRLPSTPPQRHSLRPTPPSPTTSAQRDTAALSAPAPPGTLAAPAPGQRSPWPLSALDPQATDASHRARQLSPGAYRGVHRWSLGAPSVPTWKSGNPVPPRAPPSAQNAIRGPITNAIRGLTTNVIRGPTTNVIRGPTTNAIRGPSTNAIRGQTTNAIRGQTTNAIRGPTTNAIRGPTTNAIRGPGTNAIRGPTTNDIRGPSTKDIRGPTANAVRGPATTSSLG